MAFRIEPSISVLVCSKGGGGLLNERMELVAELWEANIKVGAAEVFTCKGLWHKSVFISTESLLLSGPICPSGRSKSSGTIWICQWSWHQMPCVHHWSRCLTNRTCEGKYINVVLQVHLCFTLSRSYNSHQQIKKSGKCLVHTLLPCIYLFEQCSAIE